MGLDMYLTRTIKGQLNTQKDKKASQKELYYWRKANAIHGWFVKHVMPKDVGDYNCKKYEVSKTNLEQLVTTLTKAIKIYNNAIKIQMAY